MEEVFEKRRYADLLTPVSREAIVVFIPVDKATGLMRELGFDLSCQVGSFCQYPSSTHPSLKWLEDS
jgi:hypothetical protein